MPDQRASTKSGTADPVSHSLFFACIPPDHIKEQIVKAWQNNGIKAAKAVNYDKLHMSILAASNHQHLDPVLIERAKRAPHSLRSAPFELRFDRLTTFSGKANNFALVAAPNKPSPATNNLAASCITRCSRLASARMVVEMSLRM